MNAPTIISGISLETLICEITTKYFRAKSLHINHLSTITNSITLVCSAMVILYSLFDIMISVFKTTFSIINIQTTCNSSILCKCLISVIFKWSIVTYG